MGSRNFRLSVVLRVLALIATIVLMVVLFLLTDYYLTSLLVLAVLIYEVYSLISFVETTNTLLTNFLESLRYSDFSRTYEISGAGKSFARLSESFNQVISDFRKVREEREQNYFYLRTVVEHIGIGLIAYRQNGEVELINNATKKLFQLSQLKNLKELEAVSPELKNGLMNISNGDNILVKIREKDEILQLAIYATEFKVADKNIRLVSIKDIQSELEEKEMESWQKLIRVLTHEIMNSITPIASLTQTLDYLIKDVRERYDNIFSDEGEAEVVEEVEMALKTIHKRSTGLLHFVESYRNLTRIPKPNYTIFQVQKLFDTISSLMKEEIHRKEITCDISVEPPNLELSADEQLIEQVIINLIRNSIQALDKTDNPKLSMKSSLDQRGRILIQISDNGQGILPDVLDKIFVPFFTTKPKGSGIGLSLSRQILRLHGGTLTVHSEPDVETIFTLRF
ncbi:PAS domain-containing sensor histidine kinase [Prolixibacter sp. NT017]|uniref:sensor histidine kinase n=1 Tax=Prolixibacter sp. NT017 TaxID=2652390 RepID=UPI0012797201|nr:ATP-binding protein [Prolixibacter sp. NT017]GET24237.1 histidine kinase [Prolixibacter sp. NT017]